MNHLSIPKISNKILNKIYKQIEATLDDNDCWLWQGYCGGPSPGNIPQISINHHHYYVARIIYKLEYGTDPGNLQVNHTELPGGHNPKCLNPKHLYLGTQGANMFNRTIDNTNPGNKQADNLTKYPDSVINKVKELHKQNQQSVKRKLTQQQIADIVGISRTVVGDII